MNTEINLPRISLITTSRAEFGVFFLLIKELVKHPNFDFELIVTGNHLVPEQGYTISEILQENVSFAESIPIMFSGSDALSKAKSSAAAMASFSEVFARRKPDLIIIMGDRFELLGIASAAALMSIPIAHFSGGEITQGVIDDTVRHAITKMSQIHFVSNDEHRQRVVQLGESPDSVFNVGEPGLDNLHSCPQLSLAELGASLDFKFDSPFILFTFHPVPNDSGISSPEQLTRVLAALSELTEQYQILMTYPNYDEQGSELLPHLEAFVIGHRSRAVLVPSLGFRRYFSALNLCELVMGNSSSGLIEAPSFFKPTINIGARQAGRVRGVNVIDVPVEKSSIIEAASRVKSDRFKARISREPNPYGDGKTIPRVIDVLDNIRWPINCRKNFYDMRQA